MQHHLFPVVVLAGTAILAGCEGQVSFTGEVMPILRNYCSECHTGSGEGLEKTGFSVAAYEQVMEGTRLGPVIIAGHSEGSTLFQLISHQADPKIQMPPHHAEGLPEGRSLALRFDEIETIKDWIDEGAKNN